MIQPSCVSLTESDLCHQPAFPNTFYHTMQSYVLQVFEIVTTTAAERRHSNRSTPSRLEHAKKEEVSIGYLLFFSHVRAWSGLNGSKSWLRSVHRRRHHVRLKIIYFFRKKQATSDFCAIMLYYEKVRCIKRGE